MGDDDYAINFNGGLIQKTKHGEIVYETGHTVEDMKYCHEEVTKVGLPLVMIDTVRAYEPTPQQDVRQFITRYLTQLHLNKKESRRF